MRGSRLNRTIGIPPLIPEEMLMTSADRYRRLEQPQLFDPPRVLPAWTTLPTVVRQSLVRLLAEMLRDHGDRLAATRAEKGEAGDE